jgi:hypothetical protein
MKEAHMEFALGLGLGIFIGAVYVMVLLYRDFKRSKRP